MSEKDIWCCFFPQDDLYSKNVSFYQILFSGTTQNGQILSFSVDTQKMTHSKFKEDLVFLPTDHIYDAKSKYTFAVTAEIQRFLYAQASVGDRPYIL